MYFPPCIYVRISRKIWATWKKPNIINKWILNNFHAFRYSKFSLCLGWWDLHGRCEEFKMFSKLFNNFGTRGDVKRRKIRFLESWNDFRGGGSDVNLICKIFRLIPKSRSISRFSFFLRKVNVWIHVSCFVKFRFDLRLELRKFSHYSWTRLSKIQACFTAFEAKL